MSRSIDNAAMVFRNLAFQENQDQLRPWEDLTEGEKEHYRRMVWGVLHALFNDMESVSVYPISELNFERDAVLMLYTAMATPKNSQLGIMNQEGRTMAEAIVTALDAALGLYRR